MTDDAIQRLTDIDGNHWIDDANGNNSINTQSWGFSFNNNYINTPIPIMGQMPVYFDFLIKTTANIASNQYLVSSAFFWCWR